MKIPELKYKADTNSTYKIVEVAIANGLDPSIKEEFEEYVEKCIEYHISYLEWENEMGEDL